MGYTRTITRSKEKGYETPFKRTYIAHFISPPPDRESAMEALVAKGHLYPNHDFLCALDDLSEKEAGKILAGSPRLESFDSYYVHDRSFSDEDMAHLKQFPELKRIHIRSGVFSDHGVKELVAFDRLNELLLYSPRITDDCLRIIVQIKSLMSVDIQDSAQISNGAISSYLSNADIPEIWANNFVKRKSVGV